MKHPELDHAALTEVQKLIEENRRLRLTVAAQKAIIDMQARETGESAPATPSHANRSS
jgi:hypothetical protein